ncbi:MAG: lipopolysaccharide heptosyltransferase II [Nevskiales bacterium]
MAEKFLVVGPSWVGDMVMAQSLFKTLKQQHPECLIDVLAPGWSLPLIERMPEVRRGIELPIAHGELGLAKLWRLGRSLCGERYTRAIVLPRKFKAALVPLFAGVAHRTGYRGELRYGLINDPRPLERTVLRQTVQRFVALGLPNPPSAAPPVPRPRLRVDEARRDALLVQLGLNLDKPVIAFMPGAEYGPAKQWPAQYYAEAARSLMANERQVWLFGSKKEAALGEEIRALAGGGPVNLCGRTTLTDAVDLFSVCEAAVSNDSGLMHVAAAVGAPLVAIYGSSTPDYTPPLGRQQTVLYLRLSCSPCFERTCPLWHYNCLRHIGSEQVLTALAALNPVA